MYHSRLFHWMTPDEFTGGPTDAVNASLGGPDPTPPGPLPYADITNPQSLNKYQYALNNPLRYVDPTGRYEEDVHMDLTAALALAAGFSESDASDIGSADQGVDEGFSTHPLVQPFGYHYTNAARRNELWAAADRTGSSADLGVALHAEQDSYSHEGLSPEIHFMLRTAPDRTANDPAKADRMAAQTYGLLVRAAKGRGGTDSPVAYKEIMGYVRRFNAARDMNTKQQMLRQLREHIMKLRQRSKEACKKNPRMPCGG